MGFGRFTISNYSLTIYGHITGGGGDDKGGNDKGGDVCLEKEGYAYVFFKIVLCG